MRDALGQTYIRNRYYDPATGQFTLISTCFPTHHLVFAEEDVPLSVTVVFSSPLDGRSLFLAKHEGCFLYGTSDDWEESDPGSPAPARA
jgi:glycerol-3-phosphate dehydrogenase